MIDDARPTVKARETTPAKSRIPRFRTIEEEAEFWDTHDSTEFEDEFHDAEDVRFVKPRPTKAITVRVDPATFGTLAQQARQKGIGPSTLVRMWVLERLRATEGQEARQAS